MKKKIPCFGFALALALLLDATSSNAAILWMGGEDVDFPDNPGAVGFSTFSSVTYCRPSYARYGMWLTTANSWVMSYPFPGGAVTSAWLSAHIAFSISGASQKIVGLGKSGSGPVLGIGWTGTYMSLNKFDGTSWTQLLVASSNSPTSLAKVDMQVTDYGPNGNIKVYVNGAISPVFDYTGNIAGVPANLDTVFLGSSSIPVSEIIVSDADTRQLTLVTLAPNAAGDLSAWSGTYSNINLLLTSAASFISTEMAGAEFSSNLTNIHAAIPASSRIFGVKAASKGYTPGGAVTAYSLGLRTNATNASGAPEVQNTTWQTNEEYYATNPVTSQAWTVGDLNALQLYFKSAP